MSLRPLIVDTSLLVLFVVGSASRDYIPRHKRLKEFEVSDFDLLLNILAAAPGVLLTPNTLTETSNLVGHIAEPARTHIYKVFRYLTKTTKERYFASDDATERAEFLRLGLTDAVLLQASTDSGSLLTTDLNLYLAALAQGSVAYNFNHLRDT